MKARKQGAGDKPHPQGRSHVMVPGMPSKNMLALDWLNLQLQDSIIVGMSPGLRSSSRITSLWTTRQNARQIELSAVLKSMLAGSLWGANPNILPTTPNH